MLFSRRSSAFGLYTAARRLSSGRKASTVAVSGETGSKVYGVMQTLLTAVDVSNGSRSGDSPSTTADDDKHIHVGALLTADSLAMRSWWDRWRRRQATGRYAAPSHGAVLNCTFLGAAMAFASETPFFRFPRWTSVTMSLLDTRTTGHEGVYHTCLAPRRRTEEGCARDEECFSSDALLFLSAMVRRRPWLSSRCSSQLASGRKVGTASGRNRRYGAMPLLSAVDVSDGSMSGDMPSTIAADDKRRTYSRRRSPDRGCSRNAELVGQVASTGARYAAPSHGAVLNCTFLGAAMALASETPFFRFRRWTKARSAGSTRERLAPDPMRR